MRQGPQFQMVAPLLPVTKRLIIVNVAIWVVAVLIFKSLLGYDFIFNYFGLVPRRLILDYWVWQPFTYMFLHSGQIFHILFNMLILWWLGADLERRWGGKSFLIYYLVCGVGAAIIYLIGITIYYLFSGHSLPLSIPVVGASGAVFGLMLAYGILFGERVVYFMALFPMKAKFFVLLLGLIELVTMLNQGFEAGVANLCHLGGILTGYIYLVFWAKWKAGGLKKPGKKTRRNLKLVVDNEKEKKGQGPKYWN